jgi:YegS/Rv2252/BmrU family lipid kinase
MDAHDRCGGSRATGGDSVTTALVIGRRRPGRPIRETVRETQRLLEAAGWKVETSVVKKKRSVRKRTAAAAKDGVDVVVAVGGDGAVLQVVQSLAETKVALGIVPMGTGNLLATNLRIPSRLEHAVQVVLTGTHRQIDLGMATIGRKKRYFSVACGIGFDATVMDATSLASKRRWGKLAYAAKAVAESGDLHDVGHRIVLDGKESTMDAGQILIANFGRTGLGLQPRLRIAPDDGLFDVVAISTPGPAEGLLAVWEALRQRTTGTNASGRVLRARARSIEVKPDSKRLVEIDGSVIGTTPVSATIVPGGLTVLCPATA